MRRILILCVAALASWAPAHGAATDSARYEACMEAARAANMPIIMLCPDRKDAEAMHKLGASAYMALSDHGFMRQAAMAALKEFAGPL